MRHLVVGDRSELSVSLFAQLAFDIGVLASPGNAHGNLDGFQCHGVMEQGQPTDSQIHHPRDRMTDDSVGVVQCEVHEPTISLDPGVVDRATRHALVFVANGFPGQLRRHDLGLLMC